jgi:hypothetical protein
MAVVPLGGSLVIMQGFARQKAIARDPKKKARTFAFRRYVVPSETKESLPARIALAEAAHEAYGKSFEEVIANVIAKTSGKDYGGKAKKAKLREAKHIAAAANIARMKAKLAALK